jgi:hypothetical protein
MESLKTAGIRGNGAKDYCPDYRRLLLRSCKLCLPLLFKTTWHKCGA